jgi:hypothetical protein
MDLEFLLRRTPRWREIAEGVLFQDGDIVEHGEAAEHAADAGEDSSDGLGVGRLRGSARRTGANHHRRLARHRQPWGGSMNHLLREHAPITDANWELIDERGQGTAGPEPCGAPARRLLRAARLGVLGDQPRSRGIDPGRRRRPVTRRRVVLPLVELKAGFALSRSRAGGPATAAPLTSTSNRSTMPRKRIAEAENVAVFHGGTKAGIDGIAEAESPTSRFPPATTLRGLPERGRAGGGAAAAQRRRRPIRVRARP